MTQPVFVAFQRLFDFSTLQIDKVGIADNSKLTVEIHDLHKNAKLTAIGREK